LRAVKTGAEEVTTSEAVIAEVMYALCSSRQYNLSHADAAARLRPILALRGFRLVHKRSYVRALDLFAAYRALDSADAMIIAHLERLPSLNLLRYDTDFDRVPGVSRLEP
jgi:predicted nucleic acid-binding protein